MKEISTVGTEYHDVTGSVDALQAQLDDVMAEVAKFDAEHDVIDKDLKSLEDKAEEINTKPIGSEPDEINKQLEEVKVKRKTCGFCIHCFAPVAVYVNSVLTKNGCNCCHLVLSEQR